MDKVWVASWDVRNSGTGREVFSTKEKAINAVMEWSDWAVEEEGDSPASARNTLETTLFLGFDDREVWYNIEECEVQ